jgi:hypothetical protein
LDGIPIHGLAPEYQPSNSVVNRRVNQPRTSGLAWGALGNILIMGSDCCCLQQTTRAKNDAHNAQVSDQVEEGDSVVGSIEIHTPPMGAHASKVVLDSTGEKSEGPRLVSV